MTMPRPAQPALTFVDEHCQAFRPLFDDVRCFEHFKALHLGLLSKLPRKSLPALARFLGLSHAQGLHHLLTTPHLQTEGLRQVRTDLVRAALGERPITLLVDETGDRKKGKTTDYAARQYLGSLGKIEQGLVTVHVVALLGHITFPLLFDVFKPERCLKPGEEHRSKIKIATELLEVVASWQLNIELVVADALYGEATPFLRTLERHNWPYVLAIRDNHALYLPAEEDVWHEPWQAVERHLTGGVVEERWAQEVVWGWKRTCRFFVLTSDPQRQPPEETSFVMTNLSEEALPACLADAYGRRTWVEDAFRQMKTELGWHDWRLTRWAHVERWYELVLSVFVRVSAGALRRWESEALDREGASPSAAEADPPPPPSTAPALVDHAPGWRGVGRLKHTLEDMRGRVEAAGAALMVSAWMAWLGYEVRPVLDFLLSLRALPFS